MGTNDLFQPPSTSAAKNNSQWVFDDTWEASDAFALDHASEVDAWVKNDQFGLEVFYVHRGMARKYRPDFLIGLTAGEMPLMETKGQDTDQDPTKRTFLAEWVTAVNHNGTGSVAGRVSLDGIGRYPRHPRVPFGVWHRTRTINGAYEVQP